MANKRITELDPIGVPNGADVLEIVDVSDTTDSPEGTSKKVLVSDLGGGGGSGVATVTGDIVDNTDPANPIIEVPTIQQVLEQTPRTYSETDGDYTYVHSLFVDESGVKVFRTSITNNVTGAQNLTELLSDGGNGFPINTNYVFYPDGSQVGCLVGGYDPDTNNQAFAVQSSRAGVGEIYLGVPFQQIAGSPNVNIRGDLPTGVYDISVDTRVINANYTAVNREPITVIASCTVSDIPSPSNGYFYTVFVQAGTATIGGVGYTAGSLVHRYYNAVDGWTSKNFDFTSALALKEDLSNKVTDLTTNDNTHYPTTQAVQSAINTAVVGLLDYRGSYDASANLFPATGGSGIAGAVVKGDFWICSVAGTLGGIAITSGDLIIAIVDTPAQTSSNWDLISNELGYQAENTANKTDTVVGNTTSSTKYLSVKGYYDYLIGMTWLTDSIFGTFLNGLTAKTTPVDADSINIVDSADSNKAKKLTLANLKAFLYTNVKQVIRSKNNGTYGSHTGNTAETVILNISMTGGEFVIGDWMEWLFDFTKTGTAGNATIRFRAGTLGTTADSLISTGIMGSTVLDAGFARERFQFKTGNVLSGIAANFTADAIDIATNTVAKQSTSLDVSNNWILSVTVQLGNSADTVSCQGYIISKTKTF